jgi:predicted metal-dependent hydrolase
MGEARTAALERWYRRMAKIEIAPRADRAAAQLGRSYTTLSIRGQRTRWGSCSAAGALSFNWRLLLAPETVLDYVVWHEVCHLEVMNHSPHFWSLVAAHCPDYRADAAWLRRHGATLVL